MKIKKDKELPKFVKLNNTALRLIGDKYYRDAGDWGVKYKIIDDILVSWILGENFSHLHKKPFIKISEKEWRIDNGEYAPKFNKTNGDNCPECDNPLKAKMSGVKCTKCTYWFCY